MMQVFQWGMSKTYYIRRNNRAEKQIYFYSNCKVKVSFSSWYLFQDAYVLKHP